MKRALLLLAATLGMICLFETVDILGFSSYHPKLEAAFVANEYVLTWPKLPYLSYYEIEVLKSPPDSQDLAVPLSQRIITYRTWQNQLVVNESFPFRSYWRVSAHGLFRHPLGSYSNYLNLASVMGFSSEEIGRAHV